MIVSRHEMAHCNWLLIAKTIPQGQRVKQLVVKAFTCSSWKKEVMSEKLERSSGGEWVHRDKCESGGQWESSGRSGRAEQGGSREAYQF